VLRRVSEAVALLVIGISSLALLRPAVRSVS
jgi:hypothetical protein